VKDLKVELGGGRGRGNDDRGRGTRFLRHLRQLCRASIELNIQACGLQNSPRDIAGSTRGGSSSVMRGRGEVERTAEINEPLVAAWNAEPRVLTGLIGHHG
jgi:hypothetical protein